jgi:hypothetical protein
VPVYNETPTGQKFLPYQIIWELLPGEIYNQHDIQCGMVIDGVECKNTADQHINHDSWAVITESQQRCIRANQFFDAQPATDMVCFECEDQLKDLVKTWYPRTWFTHDGVEIKPGMRVLTIDMKWATVHESNFKTGQDYKGVNGLWFDGWFDLSQEDGGWAMMDGTRMLAKNIEKYAPKK